MLPGCAGLGAVADRLILALLLLLAATTLYNSLLAREAGSRVRPTAAALLSGTVPACKYGRQPYYFVESEGAQFNETPASWQLHAYDPRCQPRALVEVLVDADRSSRTGNGSDGDLGGNDCSVDGSRQLTAIIYGDRCAWQLTTSARAVEMRAGLA